MFSTSFSTGTGTEPRVYATVREAAAAAVNELRRARSAREKEEYDQVQRKQRAEMILGQYDQVQRKQRAETILGQYDLLMKYAVENDIVSRLHSALLSHIALLLGLTKYE